MSAGPGVRIPPPVWLAAVLAGAWALDQLIQVQIGPPAPEAGIGLAFLAVAWLGWALVTMLRARTDPRPHTEDAVLLTHGPFRFGRNPIYLGFLLLATAAALAEGTLAFWLAVPALHILLDRLVIAREEAYLATRFGQAYAAYAARVRRWM
jgi:protein-S-isoprenylcysteine O-methyltransferase Ste14